ncbi:hypothetical protein BRD08_03040 [Halobacteriales archaeon SW_10_66_29]|nr:MAG: hypothetical protein BRD08_03040 [Halobacteriales archaeon SW_10_66_29]
MPVAYRLDVVFVTVGFGLVTYLFVIPPAFLMGSWVAGRTARSVRRLAGEVDDERGRHVQRLSGVICGRDEQP